MGDTKLLNVNHLDLFLKKCLTFGGQHQNQCISLKILPKKFTAALKHLKPGIALGPDSICPELIIHVGAALKLWLRAFFAYCLRQLKLSNIWKRVLVFAIPNLMKPMGMQRDIDRYFCSVSPTTRLLNLFCSATPFSEIKFVRTQYV